MGRVEEVLLDFGGEIALVPEHEAVGKLPPYILEILEVVHVGRGHLVRVYNPLNTTDCVQLVAIIVHVLRGAVTPVGGCLNVVASHGAAAGTDILTYFDRFGVYAEDVLPVVDAHGDSPAYLLRERCQRFPPTVKLPATDEVGQIPAALLVQAVEQIILAVKMKSFRRYSQSNDFKVGELECRGRLQDFRQISCICRGFYRDL